MRVDQSRQQDLALKPRIHVSRQMAGPGFEVGLAVSKSDDPLATGHDQPRDGMRRVHGVDAPSWKNRQLITGQHRTGAG
jgi:hypothetical protein